MCRSVGLQNSAATFMPVVAWQEGSGLNFRCSIVLPKPLQVSYAFVS